MEFIVKNEQQLIEKIWPIIKDKLKGNFVIGLIGDLGAGKTTLIKRIFSKIDDNIEANSPTFTIIKSYHTNIGRLNHIDLYRLGQNCKDPDVSDALNDGISFVEWFNYYNNQDAADLIIKIENLGGETRKVSIEDIN